jgi:peptidoglycan hydrolase-like protein with peptidoglycan-binding domain
MTLTDRDPESQIEPEERPRTGRRLLVAGLALLVVGVVGGVLLLPGGSGGRHANSLPYSTATVVRTDLADRTQVDGKLGYSGNYTVVGGGQGKVTWLPSVGSVIGRGQKVYEVNGVGIPLFYGSRPLWRDLKLKVSDGPDVEELESNLSALGYGSDMTVDQHFSAETEAAVKEWQKDRGLKQTGVVRANDVVVLPRKLRVKTVTGVVGGPPQGNLLTASSVNREVTVQLSVDQQQLAVTGSEVQVQLPGGTTVGGHISSVGTVASAGNSGGGTGSGTASATIPVDITLDGSSDAGRFDGAPVTVGFTSAVHRGVLAVPVGSLLAEPGGGYAVDVVGPGGRLRTVSVQLGVFSGGQVEVSGALSEGDRVEVPSS